jgi:hypothetical protein
MEVKATLDMTIPLWGILTALCIGMFYLIKLSFDVNLLKTQLAEIKDSLKKD